ncbi:MAG TPA: hypothetical protein VJ377_09210 [Dehalococcoidales bacterium]|nr:MAG: hypothetical protein A2Z05_02465 [Chloroflexi bacterium RBG_16_60_22]HJX13686.1 hypothetical protein [Dehalococcoidales bacterium]
MDVLLSVKPHFAERIFNGTKKYEYRKTFFSRTDVNKVIVYASSPVKKIIGEFYIAGIISDKPESIWRRTGTSAGIDKDFFFRYFLGKEKGYAIKIRNPKKYEVMLDPRYIIPNFTPPQSFIYIESKKLLLKQEKNDVKYVLELEQPGSLFPLVPTRVLCL